MNIDDFTDATAQEIATGVLRCDNTSVCLVCKAVFEDGAVYECCERLFEGQRAAHEHVRLAHGSMVLHILEKHRQQAGLTEHQAAILHRMASGMSDKAIAEEMLGTTNTSAIRNLRFQLKEREKQAKVYLALMEALRAEREKNAGKSESQQTAYSGTALADERFDSTERERAAVMKAYFTADGVLKDFPVREKRKIIALGIIASRFTAGCVYTEKEVNEMIAYRDFATVRRYLIEYGFFMRSQDCARYWLKGSLGDED